MLLLAWEWCKLLLYYYFKIKHIRKMNHLLLLGKDLCSEKYGLLSLENNNLFIYLFCYLPLYFKSTRFKFWIVAYPTLKFMELFHHAFSAREGFESCPLGFGNKALMPFHQKKEVKHPWVGQLVKGKWKY